MKIFRRISVFVPCFLASFNRVFVSPPFRFELRILHSLHEWITAPCCADEPPPAFLSLQSGTPPMSLAAGRAGPLDATCQFYTTVSSLETTHDVVFYPVPLEASSNAQWYPLPLVVSSLAWFCCSSSWSTSLTRTVFSNYGEGSDGTRMLLRLNDTVLWSLFPS